MLDLMNTAYFRRIMKKDKKDLLFPVHSYFSPGSDSRLRSPSYNGESHTLLRSEQIPLKRKVSVERFQNTTNPNHASFNSFDSNNSHQISQPISPPSRFLEAPISK